MADRTGNGWTPSTTNFNTIDQWNNGSVSVAEIRNQGVTVPGNSDFNEPNTGPVGGFGQDDDAVGLASGGKGGDCFNCGEEGHMKAECPHPPKPREFTGTCNHCGEIGHQARACPSKPRICNQCYAENDHDTIDCKNKKVIDRTRIEDKSVREAWAMLKQASDEVDIGDFREAVQVLVKALDGDLSYIQLEKESRKRNFNIYLIALKKEVAMAYTNVDLEGNVGRSYTLGYFTSASCPRPLLMPLWPKDTAENLERLEDVGIPMERGVPICGNCNNVGHVRRDCPEEKNLFEGPKVTCALCDEPGHRVRDCPQERPQRKDRAPRTCKICGSEDHIAKECDNRPPEVCHNCYQEGHRKAECTNEKVFKCDNCDGIGHKARECKAPKDWARHKCRYCGEYGHGSETRCDPDKKAAYAAAKAAEEGGDGNDFGAADGFDANGAGSNAGGAGNSGWPDASTSSGQAGWDNTNTSVPVATAGGW